MYCTNRPHPQQKQIQIIEKQAFASVCMQASYRSVSTTPSEASSVVQFFKFVFLFPCATTKCSFYLPCLCSLCAIHIFLCCVQLSHSVSLHRTAYPHNIKLQTICPQIERRILPSCVPFSASNSLSSFINSSSTIYHQPRPTPILCYSNFSITFSITFFAFLRPLPPFITSFFL